MHTGNHVLAVVSFLQKLRFHQRICLTGAFSKHFVNCILQNHLLLGHEIVVQNGVPIAALNFYPSLQTYQNLWEGIFLPAPGFLRPLYRLSSLGLLAMSSTVIHRVLGALALGHHNLQSIMFFEDLLQSLSLHFVFLGHLLPEFLPIATFTVRHSCGLLCNTLAGHSCWTLTYDTHVLRCILAT